ncbi:MAG: DUF924 family protein [Burkholderiales bacterium]
MAQPWDAVLDFWFGDLSAPDYPPQERNQLWFGKSDGVDQLVRERFSEMLNPAERSQYDEWKSNSRGRLALIILFDQFPRNAYRDTPQAFAFDGKAQLLTIEGIEQGVDQALFPFERVFFYLPLEHAEDLALQQKSVESYQRLLADIPPELAQTLSGYLEYAIRHCQVIERFGRFPHRNRILGRASTSEEREFLKQPNSAF